MLFLCTVGRAARAARAARTPPTSSLRCAARAPAGAGPPGWAPMVPLRRWPHCARRLAPRRLALGEPRWPIVAPPHRWPPDPRPQPVQVAEHSLSVTHMCWVLAGRCWQMRHGQQRSWPSWARIFLAHILLRGRQVARGRSPKSGLQSGLRTNVHILVHARPRAP
jgi:hypothetical protein